ncbi:hypothetical protein OVO43_11100, partial [Streptococcus pneumoniae]|nr:hypothetical protein [Streptococcus pneumoniae]MDG7390223.1 hypothetical protein [Streptococcus pneumoniae]
HMGLFFYNKIGSIISIVDLPTTNIIEPKKLSSSHFKGIREFLYSSKISSNYASFHLQLQNTVLS